MDTAEPAGTIWNNATGTLTSYQGPDPILNQSALSNLTAGELYTINN